MNFLTEEKIQEKYITDFIENDFYESKKDKNFKLFSLNDKDIYGDINEKFEIIAKPENGKKN